MAETLGGTVRRRRIALGKTQQALATEAGLSVRALRDIEQDRVRRPRLPAMRALALALGVAESADPTFGALLSRTDPDELTSIGVLGPLRVHRHGVALEFGSAMQRHLLGLLALYPNTTVARHEIVDVLWGEHPPRTYLSALHAHVTRLRRTVDPRVDGRAAGRMLMPSRGGYRLDVDPGQLDALRFAELDTRARAAQAEGDLAAAEELFTEALGCWRGPVLQDGSHNLRGHPAAVALGRRRLSAALSLADVSLAAGTPERAVGWLQGLAADEPLHEGLHAKLMLTLAGSGEQGAALAVFAELQSRLADELGVQPGAEIQQAHLRIVRQQVPGGATPAAPVPEPESPTASRMAPAQLPLDVRGFTGRDGELGRLDAMLGDGAAQVVISAVSGTAGVGKTALAVHWAHRVRDRFPDGQLYVNLRGFDPGGSAMSPAEAVRGFLDAFEVPPRRIPASFDAQVGLYRSLLADRRVLLVLDNARDADQVRPLLPGSPTCFALVTSRNQLTSLIAAEGAEPLTLDLLTTQEAHQLLAHRVGPHRVAAAKDAVDDIVARCARLPLALTVVAARAATRPDLALDALAGELGSTSGSLRSFHGEDQSTDARAVFSWSYRALGADTARMFRLLGLHPGPDLTAPAAASLAGVSLVDAARMLAELAWAHLVTERRGRYGFHDLLRAYAGELAHTVDSADERHEARRRILDHYLHSAFAADRLLDALRTPIELPPTAPGVLPEPLADREQARAWFVAEHAVLIAAVDRAAGTGFDAVAWQLPWTLVKFLDRWGHWADWAGTQRAALAATQRLGDPRNQALMHRSLGHAYTRLGDYEKAIVQYQRAFDIYRELGDPAGQALSLFALSEESDREGRHDEALRHAERALELIRAAADKRWEGLCLNTVGWYHARLGDYDRALECCEEALGLLESLGDKHGQAATRDSLGYIHHLRGDDARAQECYRFAADVFGDLGERFYEADVRTRLGESLLVAGDTEGARQAYRRALEILDDLGHGDADTVRAHLDELDTDRT